MSSLRGRTPSRRDRQLIETAFSDPLSIPPDWKGWLEAYLEPMVKDIVRSILKPTAADLAAIGTPQTYTPVLTATTTNPTMGTGAVAAGEYIQIGKLVAGRAVIVFGGTGMLAGSGTYRISLPVAAPAAGPKIGSGDMLDNSVPLVRIVGAELADTQNAQFRVDNAGLGLVTHAVPWAWAPNDQISFFYVYRAA